MALLCRLIGCRFDLLVLDGGALRLRCTRCLGQTAGWRIP